jgi:hypothetical protein
MRATVSTILDELEETMKYRVEDALMSSDHRPRDSSVRQEQ